MSDANETSRCRRRACVVATAPVLGHHAFGGEFDPNKPVLLKGR